MGKFATAILLLAGALVLVAAGAGALAASHDQTRSTLEGAGDSIPPVLDMGQEMQSSILAALPWVGMIAVPLFIVGVLGTVAYKGTSTAGRGG